MKIDDLRIATEYETRELEDAAGNKRTVDVGKTVSGLIALSGVPVGCNPEGCATMTLKIAIAPDAWQSDSDDPGKWRCLFRVYGEPEIELSEKRKAGR